MPKTQLNIIKPALGFNRLVDGDLLARLNAVHDGLLNNPAYPNLPVDPAVFKAGIDAFTAAAAAAVIDGGKSAIAQRDKTRSEAVAMMRLLGHYVESACKGDMNTFISSGFVAATHRPRTPAEPVSVPSILKIDQGQSGQLLVAIESVKARSYEIRYAPVPAPGSTFNWTSIVVPNAQPATPIDNLIPGTTYTFQVRAYGKLGYSDWSGSAQRMTI
jgi:Fibronectin type III domain